MLVVLDREVRVVGIASRQLVSGNERRRHRLASSDRDRLARLELARSSPIGQHVAVTARDEPVLAPRPLDCEPNLLVAAHGASVVGAHLEAHPVQVEVLESVAADRADRILAEAMVPVLSLADEDAEERATMLGVQTTQADRADEAGSPSSIASIDR